MVASVLLVSLTPLGVTLESFRASYMSCYALWWSKTTVSAWLTEWPILFFYFLTSLLEYNCFTMLC